MFNSFKFTRAGTYPDDPNDPKTPWGGQPYPTVTNVGGQYRMAQVAAEGIAMPANKDSLIASDRIENRRFRLSDQSSGLNSRIRRCG